MVHTEFAVENNWFVVLVLWGLIFVIKMLIFDIYSKSDRAVAFPFIKLKSISVMHVFQIKHKITNLLMSCEHSSNYSIPYLTTPESNTEVCV